MVQEKKQPERVYKVRTIGERTQKMMSFRVDNENWEYLQGFRNKGRKINELIERDRLKKK